MREKTKKRLFWMAIAWLVLLGVGAPTGLIIWTCFLTGSLWPLLLLVAAALTVAAYIFVLEYIEKRIIE